MEEQQQQSGQRPGGHGEGRDIALSDVQAEFPSWNVWQGTRGGFYAKPPTPPIAFGATPAALLDSIRLETADMESRWPPVSSERGP